MNLISYRCKFIEKTLNKYIINNLIHEISIIYDEISKSFIFEFMILFIFMYILITHIFVFHSTSIYIEPQILDVFRCLCNFNVMIILYIINII